MEKCSRVLILGVGTILAVGTVTACSTGSQVATSSTASSTSAVVPMPSAATFIADSPVEGGQTTMTMAIAVDGARVVAYATNGSDEEAYFVGAQTNGQMDLMSMYGDELKASFDGKSVSGEVTMNETGTAPVEFAAVSVAAPAGMYTAVHGNSRASWVVRPDHTMTGVMDNSAPGDHKVTDAIMANDQAFKDRVRQMRVDRQLQPAPHMSYGTWSMHMGDSTVTAVRVTGDMSL